MIAMLHGPDSHLFNSPERATLQALDRRRDHLFPERPAAPRAMILRLASPPGPTARSFRLPVDWVLHSGSPPNRTCKWSQLHA